MITKKELGGELRTLLVRLRNDMISTGSLFSAYYSEWSLSPCCEYLEEGVKIRKVRFKFKCLVVPDS